MHHYSLHFHDLSRLIHDLVLLEFHIVAVVDAAAAGVMEISQEGTAVVAQHEQQQQQHLFLPSLIGYPYNF